MTDALSPDTDADMDAYDAWWILPSELAVADLPDHPGWASIPDEPEAHQGHHPLRNGWIGRGRWPG